MNELIRIENGEVKADSRMVAEHFNKEHAHVMRDIRDEIEKLEQGGESGQSIFGESSYINQQNREMPCYIMTEEGLMQLAARYDAVARRKLIVKIKELKSTQQRQPQSPMEFIALMAQQALEQERKLTEIKGTVQVIKDAMVPIEDDWRAEIKRMINRIALKLGGGQNEHQKVRQESYELLEKKAHANLEIRMSCLKRKRTQTSKSGLRTFKTD